MNTMHGVQLQSQVYNKTQNLSQRYTNYYICTKFESSGVKNVQKNAKKSPNH